MAEKLKSGRLPFVVHGNPDRLGPVAADFTLEAQAKRHPSVLSLEREVERHAKILEKLQNRIESLNQMGDLPADQRKRKRQIKAMQHFPFGTPNAQEHRERFIADGWRKVWETFVLHKHAALFADRSKYSRALHELAIKRLETRSAVRVEIAERAQAILSTVASASSTLFARAELAAPLARCRVAILDEVSVL